MFKKLESNYVVMAGMAEELRVESVLDHPGTVSVGECKIMWENTSVGGRIPKEHARSLGVIDAGELEVYVNYELGVVMHKIPEAEDG